MSSLLTLRAVNHTPPALGHAAPCQSAQDAACQFAAFLDGVCAFIAAHMLGRLFLSPFLTRLRAASGQLRRLTFHPGTAAPLPTAAAFVPRPLLSCHAVQPPHAPCRPIPSRPATASHPAAGVAANPPARHLPAPDLHPAPDPPPRSAVRAKPAYPAPPSHVYFVAI